MSSQLRPRGWLTGLSSAAAAALVALAAASSQRLLAAVVLVLQVAVAVVWFPLVGATGAAGGFLLSGVAVLVVDFVVLRSHQASLAPIAGAVAMCFVASFAHQLGRRGRRRPTQSLAATVTAAITGSCFATLIAMWQLTAGAQLVAAWAVGAGTCLLVGRLADLLPWGPRVAGSARSLLGEVLGLLGAAGVGAVLGSFATELSPGQGVAVAVAGAVAAAAVDLAAIIGASDIDPADAVRVRALRPTLVLIPLALSAPASYVVGRLLLG